MTNSADGAPAPLQAATGHHQRGELAAARDLYRRHLEAQPDDAPAWCLLAALEGQAGDHAAAGAAFRNAIEADPGHAPGHAGLGTSLLLGGQPAAAIAHFREALALQSGLHDARAQLALALHRSGRLDEAIAARRELVAHCPDDLQARHDLGMALLERGDAAEARDLFAELSAREPQRAEVWLGLASAQIRLDDVVEAGRSLTRALQRMPRTPAARTRLGHLLRQHGRAADARRCFEAALAPDPKHLPALAALADLDRAEGDWRSGLARVMPALEAGPRPHPLLMTTAASLLVASAAWQEAESRISQWLADPQLGDGPRARLERLRGEALDRLGRHDDAWRSWTAANERLSGSFDPDDFDRTIDALIAAFDRPAVSIGAPPELPRPLLIVGMPRTGKSILEQLLAAHPEVYGAGERRIVGTLTELARSRAQGQLPYPACVRGLDEAAQRELAGWYGAALRRLSPTAQWITDTQPTNYLHLALLHRLRPDMRVVFCRREPLDLAWACYTRGIPDRALAFTTDPAWLGRYAAGMARLMEHWTGMLSIPVLTVDYESLVAQPEQETRRVLSFLDLEWDPVCAEYDRPGVATLSAPAATSRPLDGAEIGRSQPYAAHLGQAPGAVNEHGDG